MNALYWAAVNVKGRGKGPSCLQYISLNHQQSIPIWFPLSGSQMPSSAWKFACDEIVRTFWNIVQVIEKLQPHVF